MPTKYATVVIEVDDKSLIELGAEMQQVAINLSKLKTGTKEWITENQKLGALKTKFNEVTREAQKLQNVVEKVGSPEQLRAFAKLGAGMVGAFTAASGSLKMLGVNSEAFDEMTAKATTLMSIMGGLNQVAETFSAENLKGLKSIGAGFGQLVTTVKTASMGMKVALASTGIGLLVVGVGLLIANWDKIAAKMNGQAEKEKKAREEAVTFAKNMVSLSDLNLKSAEEQLKIEEEASKYSKNSTFVARERLSVTEKQIEKNRADYEETIQRDNELLGLMEKQTEEEKKKSAEEIQSNVFKRSSLDLDRNTLEITKKQNVQDAENVASLDASNEALRQSAVRMALISKEAFNQRESYEAQRQDLVLQIGLLKSSVNYEGQITVENQQQINILNAQIKVMDAQEKLRQEELSKAIELLKVQEEFAANVSKTTAEYTLLIDTINQEYNYIEKNGKALEDNVTSAKKMSDVYQDLIKKRGELFNFDEKGRLMFEKQNMGVEEQLKAYDELVEKAKQRVTFGALLLQEDRDKVDLNLKIVDAYSKELAFFTAIETNTQEKLKGDIALLEVKKKQQQAARDEIQDVNELNDLEKQRLQGELAKAKVLLNNAQSTEESKARLEEVVRLEGEIAAINQGLLDSKVQITDANAAIIATDTEIIKKNDEIAVSVDKVVVKENEVTAEVVKQSRAYAELQAWLGKYAEEIEAVRQALFNSIEFIAALQDRKAADAQARIDDYNNQLTDLASAEESHKQRLIDLEAELKDANGTRYDELMARIAEENAAYVESGDLQKEIAASIAEDEKKKLAADARAAKWRKANSLIEATVAGALAVIKALPNVFLAVATGVAAAASIGIIAAQKTPDIPKGYAKGTLATPRTELALVGEEGPELVMLPAQTRVFTNAETVGMLGSGVQKFANGGMVKPTLDTGGQGIIDYDRLIYGIANALTAMPAPVVSVVKITQAQQEVSLTKVQAGLSR